MVTTKLREALPFILGLGGALVAGWLVFPTLLYSQEDQPVAFNHALHVGDDVGMSCEDCHGFDSSGRFSGIPPLQTCLDCHEGGESLGDGHEKLVEHLEKNEEIPWRVYSRQPDGTYFSHAEHVLAGEIPCERCHGEHGKSESLRPLVRNKISGYSRDIWGEKIHGFTDGPPDSMKMSDCEDCHAQRGVAGGCLTCHK